MITKEQFKAYEKVRKGGKTNMFDVNQVMRLSKFELNLEEINEIMKTYSELMGKYPGVRK